MSTPAACQHSGDYTRLSMHKCLAACGIAGLAHRECVHCVVARALYAGPQSLVSHKFHPMTAL